MRRRPRCACAAGRPWTRMAWVAGRDREGAETATGPQKTGTAGGRLDRRRRYCHGPSRLARTAAPGSVTVAAPSESLLDPFSPKTLIFKSSWRRAGAAAAGPAEPESLSRRLSTTVGRQARPWPWPDSHSEPPFRPGLAASGWSQLKSGHVASHTMFRPIEFDHY